MSDAAPRQVCRHFLGNLAALTRDTPCRIGHPITKIVRARHKDSPRLRDRLPCNSGSECVVECPSRNFLTDAEIAEADAKAEDDMRRFEAGLPALNAMRSELTPDTLYVRDCPWCGATDALSVAIAGLNGHMRANCNICETGFLE